MSTTPPSGPPPNPASLPTPLTRARDGRWLAGVSAGVARHRNIPVGSVRGAFALAGLIGGVGVLAYVACWLIIPSEIDDETRAAGTRGIVVLAQGAADCAGLATLAALGAAAAIFGFGWAVLVIASIVLLGALVTWPRVGVGWTLLPIAALVLPAMAMKLGDVNIVPTSRDVAIAPQSVADLASNDYRSGLGSLVVDLRQTAFPSKGNITLRIDAGIRRTVVALPEDRCVHVDLHYDVVPFAARLASIVSGRDAPFSGVALFGNVEASRAGEDGNAKSPSSGSPTLTIFFHSAGGGLYVRDYPNGVDPLNSPDWPGYPVSLEPRPDTTGTPPAAARRLIDGWLARRRVQSASAAALDRLLPGPCGARPGQPPAGLATGTPTTKQYLTGPVPPAAKFTGGPKSIAPARSASPVHPTSGVAAHAAHAARRKP